jgi:alpha-glucosidase
MEHMETMPMWKNIDFAAANGFDGVFSWRLEWRLGDWFGLQRLCFDFVTLSWFWQKEFAYVSKWKWLCIMKLLDQFVTTNHMDEAYQFMKDNGYDAVKVGM